jgi:hypothetical protein
MTTPSPEANISIVRNAPATPLDITAENARKSKAFLPGSGTGGNQPKPIVTTIAKKCKSGVASTSLKHSLGIFVPDANRSRGDTYMHNSNIHYTHDGFNGRVPPSGLRRTKIMGRFRQSLRDMAYQLEPEDVWLLINEIISTKNIPGHELDSVPAKQCDD